MKEKSGKIKKIVLLACVSMAFHFPFSTFHMLQAQDIHFSMLDLDPLLFNPAYSGFFDGTGRFGVVYRNQWASVSTPFQTVTATAEFSLMRSTRNRNGLSAGLWVSADRAGSIDYGATTVSAIASWYQALGNGDNLISLGLEAGMGQVGFNLNNISLGDGSETFPATSAFFPTFGAGVAWFSQWSDRFYTKAGFSMRNINEPDISYLATDNSRLARKWNLYARGEWRRWERISLLPVVGFQHQGTYSELVYGADVRWYVNERPSDYLVFSAGITGRHADAASINLALLWREWTFAFSYDANISRLAEASHTLGAFELGVLYMIGKKDRKHSALPCPII